MFLFLVREILFGLPPVLLLYSHTSTALTLVTSDTGSGFWFSLHNKQFSTIPAGQLTV